MEYLIPLYSSVITERNGVLRLALLKRNPTVVGLGLISRRKTNSHTDIRSRSWSIWLAVRASCERVRVLKEAAMAHENRRFFSPFFATGGTYPETEAAIASTRLSCGRDAKGRDAVCRRLTAAWHRPANLGDHQPGQGTGYACAQTSFWRIGSYIWGEQGWKKKVFPRNVSLSKKLGVPSPPEPVLRRIFSNGLPGRILVVAVPCTEHPALPCLLSRTDPVATLTPWLQRCLDLQAMMYDVRT